MRRLLLYAASDDTSYHIKLQASSAIDFRVIARLCSLHDFRSLVRRNVGRFLRFDNGNEQTSLVLCQRLRLIALRGNTVVRIVVDERGEVRDGRGVRLAVVEGNLSSQGLTLSETRGEFDLRQIVLAQ